MTPVRWLLEETPPAAQSGTWNMGLDEALLALAHQAGVATLRLYTWAGPWLSLGYAQRLSTDRERSLEEGGVAWVRRATGGSAVLHGCDLTYSIAAPCDFFPPGLRGSYGAIAGVIEAALASFGVRLERVGSPGSGQREFDCFASPAWDEICVGGRKLVGSAQRRTESALLQHGSIRVSPDSARVVNAAGLTSGVATSLAEQGVQVSTSDLAERFAEAFCGDLGVSLVRVPVAAELRAAALGRSREAPPPRPLAGDARSREAPARR
jgi:lipoate-protein ligase A